MPATTSAGTFAPGCADPGLLVRQRYPGVDLDHVDPGQGRRQPVRRQVGGEGDQRVRPAGSPAVGDQPVQFRAAGRDVSGNRLAVHHPDPHHRGRRRTLLRPVRRGPHRGRGERGGRASAATISGRGRRRRRTAALRASRSSPSANRGSSRRSSSRSTSPAPTGRHPSSYGHGVRPGSRRVRTVCQDAAPARSRSLTQQGQGVVQVVRVVADEADLVVCARVHETQLDGRAATAGAARAGRRASGSAP